jgi:three-Cys-motif partner protein
MFYFLPIWWLNRAILATTKDHDKIAAWWGRPDWMPVVDMQHHQKAATFQKRFLELGYRYVLPFPILDREKGNRVMFYMILATDHPEAPKLMWRAYNKGVHDEAGWDQLALNGMQVVESSKFDATPRRSPTRRLRPSR